MRDISAFGVAIMYDQNSGMRSASASSPESDDERRRRFASFFVGASDDAVDLLIQLLRFNPKHRVSAEQALEHPYVQQFHDPVAERSATRCVSVPVSDDEKRSTNYYRDQLYGHITTSKAANSRRGEREAGWSSERQGRGHSSRGNSSSSRQDR